MVEDYFEKIISGDVAIVNSVGIITAENPGEETLTKIGNERKNKLLVKDLEKLGYAPLQMKGKFFGKAENPFMLINISREKLIELGNKYKQQFVIFGHKRGGKFRFSLIKNNRTIQTGKLGMEYPENQLDDNCYFAFAGKKFNIRFSR